MDGGWFQNDNCSSPSSSLSQIALYSHEYFIFILLKKRSVPFVLPLLCILTRSSSLFGEKKKTYEVNGCDEDKGWSKGEEAGSLISEIRFALRTTDLTTLQH